MMRLALASGHHNTDGGNPYEAETTGLLTPRIAYHCRQRGMDVRCPQPDDGRGQYPGGIWDVARQVVAWARAGWVADVLLETHTQGVADPTVRGLFGIYPDAPGDLDTDARDHLIPLLVRRLAEATGMPPAGTGGMSETRTGVGLQGYRLGMFGQTVALRESTTRILFEFGAHTNPVERAMHRDPVWIEATARAVASALAEFGGIVDPQPPPVPAFVVGAGIIAALAAEGDVPASDETFLLDDGGRRLSFVVGRAHLAIYVPATDAVALVRRGDIP